MGAIAKSQQALSEPQTKKEQFKGLLASVAPQLQSVLPKGFTVERLTQLAIAAYTRTPKLAECDNASVLSCLLTCASLGMEPSEVDKLGRAYIIPRWNGRTERMEAQFQLGKNGMIELMRRSGKVLDFATQCVFEGDSFDFYEDETGRHFTYRPNFNAERTAKNLRMVYFSAHLVDGGSVFVWMSKAEIDGIKNRAAAKSGPWVTDYLAMAEKTVIRRAFNRGYMPVSVEAMGAVKADETTPVVVTPDGEQLFAVEPVAERPDEGGESADVDPKTGEVIE